MGLGSEQRLLEPEAYELLECPWFSCGLRAMDSEGTSRRPGVAGSTCGDDGAGAVRFPQRDSADEYRVVHDGILGEASALTEGTPQSTARRDITERKQAEASLEKRKPDLIEHAPSAIYEFDFAGRDSASQRRINASSLQQKNSFP
jgi:hypothetical protein